jgi:RimJ/RimL family protein N-acetyltransferase
MRALATPELALEPLTAADAGEMFELLGDPALHAFTDSAPPGSRDELHQRYERLESRRSPDGREHWLNWVVRGRDGRAMGFVQATVFEGTSAWVAYLIARSYAGNGHATAATRAMLEHLHAEYSVTRFLARIERANERSLRLVQRLGFRVASAAEVTPWGLSATEQVWVLELPPFPGGRPA